ncbi:MAG TPA: hypothetical protein VJ865_08170 [Gemmatimonadaceae bacterium]|nr:hypothetical protein [Gemmatimonadaceae bacterium]
MKSDVVAVLRFFASLVGFLSIGGAVAQLTQGVAIDRVIFIAAVGCIGLAVYDPRGRWFASLAAIVGAFGLAGLNIVLRRVVRHQTSWAEASLWKTALYAACLAGFFVWSARNKRALAKAIRVHSRDDDHDAAI